MATVGYCSCNVAMDVLSYFNLAAVRPPTGLFYIERDPHSRTEIGERDIVLSAQEGGHGDVAQGNCVSQATQAE